MFGPDRPMKHMGLIVAGLATYGLIKMSMNLWSGLSFIKRNYLRGRYDLMDRYGEKGKSWAVVTGGSDGIGLELCRQLAETGFNICMIARN